MKHSLGTAAIATGKSKTTIHRAIKSGKLSAFRKEDGTFEIDPAELHRVFDAVTSNVTLKGIDEKNVTGVTALIEQENTFLKQQLEREREIYRETLASLERKLDASEAERRSTQEKITLLLEYKSFETIDVKKAGTNENLLWKKIFKQTTFKKHAMK